MLSKESLNELRHSLAHLGMAVVGVLGLCLLRSPHQMRSVPWGDARPTDPELIELSPASAFSHSQSTFMDRVCHMSRKSR
jgi:hypothetical protein